MKWMRSIIFCMMFAMWKVEGGVECDVCTTTSIVVENVLLHNATASNTFQDASAALCANVPREMREVCQDATARLNSKVFECLIHRLEFHSICSDPFVDLCVASRTTTADSDGCAGFEPDALGCAACEFAVSGLQQYVNDTSTMIVKAVRDDICRYHFEEEHQQEQCDVVLTGFGDVALRVLASRLDAAEFCCGLGLCEAVSGKRSWIKGPTDLNSPY